MDKPNQKPEGYELADTVHMAILPAQVGVKKVVYLEKLKIFGREALMLGDQKIDKCLLLLSLC